MHTSPRVTESSPARQCISVDLPEPGRAHDRGEPAALELDAHPPQRDDLRLAAAVHLPHVAGPGRGLRLPAYRRGHVIYLFRLLAVSPPPPLVGGGRSHLPRPARRIRPTRGGRGADFPLRVGPEPAQGCP